MRVAVNYHFSIQFNTRLAGSFDWFDKLTTGKLRTGKPRPTYITAGIYANGWEKERQGENRVIKALPPSGTRDRTWEVEVMSTAESGVTNPFSAGRLELF
jgi:hypothetical protein